MKNTTASVVDRRLHGDYWATEPDGRVRLDACECIACGACFLPAIATCVECGNTEFRTKRLSRTGSLYTYTIVRGSGGLWPDVYAIGYVDYPENVRVCGQLLETEPNKLAIGMSMTTVEATLYRDRDGAPVNCFQFVSAENDE